MMNVAEEKEKERKEERRKRIRRTDFPMEAHTAKGALEVEVAAGWHCQKPKCAAEEGGNLTALIFRGSGAEPVLRLSL